MGHSPEYSTQHRQTQIHVLTLSQRKQNTVKCSEDQNSNTVLHKNLPLILSVQFSRFRSLCNWQTELLDHRGTGPYTVVTEFHSVTPRLNIITNTKMTFRKKRNHFCFASGPSKYMFLFLVLSLSEEFSFGNVWIIIIDSHYTFILELKTT